jgi:hypothetical protein
VPVERDPVSGRLLSGDPLGRGDKGRGSADRRPGGRAVLVAACSGAVLTAVVGAVVLLTGGDDPAAPAAAGTTEQPRTVAPSAPVADSGPRDVAVTMTVTAVTPPPGFGSDPAYGTVGQEVAATWTIAGACDGTGPCEVTYCQGADRCAAPFTGEPGGAGYQARFSAPVAWREPQCSGGAVDNLVTWTMSGGGDDVVVSGTWVQQATQVLFPGSDGRDCGVYLVDFAMSSSGPEPG